jgi:hypothetical protein
MPTCILDGQVCNPALGCCSGPCDAQGKCGGTACQPDGTMCTAAAQCCGGHCVAGVCASSSCPSDGTACGDCIQSMCCMQAAPCLANKSCAMELECLIACVKNGGSIGTCFVKCDGNPVAVQAALCVGANCGKGICL